jgi:hypothetical protein
MQYSNTNIYESKYSGSLHVRLGMHSHSKCYTLIQSIYIKIPRNCKTPHVNIFQIKQQPDRDMFQVVEYEVIMAAVMKIYIKCVDWR